MIRNFLIPYFRFLDYFADMKPIATVLFLLILTACNNSSETNNKEAGNDVDAARDFLTAALKGRYQEASAYMVQDSTNQGYMAATERKYAELSADEKRNLSEASIWFYDPILKNDSTSIIVFANSYRKDKDTLRITRQGNKWLVDLKYLFLHDMDTTIIHNLLPKDSTNK